jgi:rare lipoprotein A (peptidoglycan hydrolase)
MCYILPLTVRQKDNTCGGALATSISKMVLMMILSGGVLLMSSWRVADQNGGEEAVNSVATVHHSDLATISDEDGVGKKMLASYYGRSLEGSPMANGHTFDAENYTAAHRSLPFGTKLEVSYGGESVRVAVTDRGPYVAGRDLDLSLAAAQKIGLTGQGEAPVRVRVISRAEARS